MYGGAYWTRTSDPIDVNDVLYQLSQSTKHGHYNNANESVCQALFVKSCADVQDALRMV